MSPRSSTCRGRTPRHRLRTRARPQCTRPCSTLGRCRRTYRSFPPDRFRLHPGTESPPRRTPRRRSIRRRCTCRAGSSDRRALRTPSKCLLRRPRPCGNSSRPRNCRPGSTQCRVHRTPWLRPGRARPKTPTCSKIQRSSKSPTCSKIQRSSKSPRSRSSRRACRVRWWRRMTPRRPRHPAARLPPRGPRRRATSRLRTRPRASRARR
jgi:hypothetical protein